MAGSNLPGSNLPGSNLQPYYGTAPLSNNGDTIVGAHYGYRPIMAIGPLQ